MRYDGQGFCLCVPSLITVSTASYATTLNKTKKMTPIQDLLQDQQRLSRYHQAALRRSQDSKQERESRRQLCLCIAHKISQQLKEKFNPTKVALFGSILDPETFTQWSDIDIAVWGLTPEQTFPAMDFAQSFSNEVEINLIDINTVKPELYQRILENHQEI